MLDFECWMGTERSLGNCLRVLPFAIAQPALLPEDGHPCLPEARQIRQIRGSASAFKVGLVGLDRPNLFQGAWASRPLWSNVGETPTLL